MSSPGEADPISSGPVVEPIDRVQGELGLPIFWPHEVGEAMRWGRFMAGEAVKSRVLNFANRGVARAVNTMERINGPGTGPAANKFEFINMMARAGYNVPNQVSAWVGDPPEARVGQVREVFPHDDEVIICKPYNGINGGGIVEMVAGNLDNFLPEISEDYIVQHKIDKQGEVRYVREVDYKGGRILRAYDEKDIANTVGDGKATKLSVIWGSGITLASKLLTLAQNPRSLKQVVPEGNLVHLSTAGVPHKAKLEWRAENRQRVSNMDVFMRGFLEAMRKGLGVKLPPRLLASDLGIRDQSALEGKYDEEAMRESVIPFECQMPFMLFSYVFRSRKYPDGMIPSQK